MRTIENNIRILVNQMSVHRLILVGPEIRGVTNSVSALELPEEHAPVCGNHAQIFVQQRSEEVSRLLVVHGGRVPAVE